MARNNRKSREKREKQKRARVKKTALQSDKRLVVPPGRLIRPLTQYERRMTQIPAWFIPGPRTPEGEAISAFVEREAQKDLWLRSRINKTIERVIPWLNAQLHCGSGFQMSHILRYFVHEYADRIMHHGIRVMPSSFNLVESFLVYDQSVLLFGLRPEREHLLDLTDYFDWYESDGFPRQPSVLNDVLQEGVVYSYDMVSDSGGYIIQGPACQFVLAGASLIRHGNELTCMLLAGTRPPVHSDSKLNRIDPTKAMGTRRPGKEEIEPGPDWSVGDRYLEGFPEFVRVVALVRIDLDTSKFDVRYVLEDAGRSYLVATDDEDIGLSPEEAARYRDANRLERYYDLISALGSLIYLPVAFTALANRTEELTFATRYASKASEAPAEEMRRRLKTEELPETRTIRCLRSVRSPTEPETRTVQPPKLEFQREGFWKTLAPGVIGKDANGMDTVGRTWVTRHESWNETNPSSFVLHKNLPPITGADPGIIYVMRSGAHHVDVYKVGLTRRTGEIRAGELSRATGVALPFGVLASWEVGNCAAVEREAHKRLDPTRINPAREFFHGPLSAIISTIQSIVTGN